MREFDPNETAFDRAASLSLDSAIPPAAPSPESKATQSPERLAPLNPGYAYAVLVASGTPGDVGAPKKRPWPDLGQIVSFLENMGVVYRYFSRWVGPERIITIGMLDSTIRWLERCVERGHPPCLPEHLEACKAYYRITDDARLEKKKNHYSTQLANLKAACRPILDAGGTDYDGDLVNPQTVVQVLTGEAPHGRKCVPKTGARSMFLWFNMHGSDHAVSVGVDEKGKPIKIQPGDRKCDVCNKPHLPKLEKNYSHGHSTLATREWYMLMSHRSRDEKMYEYVSTAGHNMDPASPIHESSPLSRFYWQHMFRAIHKVQKSDPGRAVVCLYQFCTSGGHLKWMKNPGIRRFHSTHKWPIFMMATSRELQYSLGFSFSKIFLAHLAHFLARGSALEKRVTLQESYDATLTQYWDSHRVEKRYNERAVTASARFGEVDFVVADGSGIGDQAIAELFLNEKAPTGGKSRSPGASPEPGADEGREKRSKEVDAKNTDAIGITSADANRENEKNADQKSVFRGNRFVVVYPDGLYVRKEPFGTVVGAIECGETVVALQKSGDWIRHESGWSAVVSSEGKPYMERRGESTSGAGGAKKGRKGSELRPGAKGQGDGKSAARASASTDGGTNPTGLDTKTKPAEEDPTGEELQAVAQPAESAPGTTQSDGIGVKKVIFVAIFAIVVGLTTSWRFKLTAPFR